MSKTPTRRRFARVALEAQVRVNFPGVEARRKLFLDNLSADGLFLRTDQPKPVGTKLRFEFAVRDGGPPIIGTGEVRWVENDPEKTRGMGVKFSKINQEGRQELTRAVRSLEADGRRVLGKHRK